MKQQKWRVLLSLLLAMCFCLSAFAPVYAADGLWGGFGQSPDGSLSESLSDSWKKLWDRLFGGDNGTQDDSDVIAATDDEATIKYVTKEKSVPLKDGTFYRIVHVDCGRKYFSVDELKTIIKYAADYNYTHVELAFGNDGLRFLLDDMSVMAYDSDKVTGAVQAGNKAFYNAGTNELTQTEMDELIEYAKSNQIGIIPMFDAPGHLQAVIRAMITLDVMSNGVGYSTPTTSGTSVNWALDPTNVAGVNFVQALMQKYISYFAGKGCTMFNIAADECGFTDMNPDTYSAYAKMVNSMAAMVQNAGMTALAFNDGIYHIGLSTAVEFDNNIAVCYWDASSDKYAPAATLASKGFKIINTHNKWYYVAGKNSGDWYSYSWVKTNMEGRGSYPAKECYITDGGYEDSKGCMFAFWCDIPGAEFKSTELFELMKILSSNNPTYFVKSTTPAFSLTLGKTFLKPGESTTVTANKAVATWASDSVAVGITSNALDVSGTTATVTAYSVGNAVITATTADGETATISVTVSNEEYEVTRKITVSVGETISDKLEGYYYSMANVNMKGSSEFVSVDSVNGFKQGDTIQSYEEISVTYSNLASQNYNSWQSTGYYYKHTDGNYYPLYVQRSGRNTYTYTFGYSIDEGLTKKTIGSYNISRWNTSNVFDEFPVYKRGLTEVDKDFTTVTFTGKKEIEETTVIIGHVLYQIHVNPENLSNAPKLPIQLWITGQTIQVNQDGMISSQTSGNFGSKKAQYLEISATTELNTLTGVPLSTCVPEEIKDHYEYDGTWWIAEQTGKLATDFLLYRGTVLNKESGFQGVWGSSMVNSGIPFQYIRYYGGEWAVSSTPEDPDKWVGVTGQGGTGSDSTCTEQLVAYYYMRTKLTDEVTTNVVDWGDDISDKYENKAVLDFAVKYESGLRVPDTFPNSGKTRVYNTTGNVIMRNGYRVVDEIKPTKANGFKVYMITLTPIRDDTTAVFTSDHPTNSAYTYAGTEKVVWVDDAANLPEEFKDQSRWYSSPSGQGTVQFNPGTGVNVGGEPIISEVEIYQQQGLLVTYYVRSANEYELKVHYIDEKDNSLIYEYGITVENDKIEFDHNFMLVDGTKFVLANNTVKGIYQTETVSAKLSDMPAISKKYTFMQYTCTKVEFHENNYKEVYLYYTFNNIHDFVLDFGLPLKITRDDISVDEQWTDVSVSVPSYGTAYIGLNEGLTYTPNKPIDKVEKLIVTFSTTDNDGKTIGVSHYINIYPASNVLYEESFFKQTGWTTEGTADTTRTQQAAKLGDAAKNQNPASVYGYDSAYAGDSTYSGGSALKAEVKVSSTDVTAPASFTFTGTGFDIISECGLKTGMLFVRVTKDGNYVKSYLVDTYFKGDMDANGSTIMPEGTMTYQIPVVRNTELPHGTYTVTVYGALYRSSGAVKNAAAANAVYGLDTVNNDADGLYAMLAQLGVSDEELSNLEFVYMDENSVLNGGSGAQPVYDSEAGLFSTYANEETDSGYYVYLDGFRVYNPLGLKDGGTSDQYKDDNESEFVYTPVLGMLAVDNIGSNENITNYFYVEGDGSKEVTTENITDYQKKGPQNEVYLAPNTAIAFMLDNTDVISIQISAKAVDGNAIVKNADGTFAGKYPVMNSKSIYTCTEMYYSITKDETTGFFVVTNTGTGVLSISELKVPVNTAAQALTDEDKEDAINAINAVLSYVPVDPVDPEPEPEPETFEPQLLKAYAPAVALRRWGATITVTSSIEEGMEVYIRDENGESMKLTPNNTRMVRWGLADTYRYSFNTGRLAAGTHTYYVYAVKDGLESVPVAVTFTVW